MSRTFSFALFKTKTTSMLFIRLLFITLFFHNTTGEKVRDSSTFISPLRIPLSLSSNFGELRIDHFHSGIDIKTQGVVGKEVIATASGYIYWISVSPGGFGKAIHLRHPSGYSTIYGHLDHFAPEIENYVKARQYESKSFRVMLFPPQERFRIKQGDVIAYSGNSGSSTGPHLHYEIRRSESELPMNPLLFDFGQGDNIEPVIEKLVIYPLSPKTIINKQNSPKRFNVSGGRGSYSIPSGNEIEISGPAGFGIKSFDLLNDSYNRCAVYSTELIIDSMSIFKYVMDSFSFGETRYVNSHIDYETFMKEGIYIERTFLLPNDKLSAYRHVVNRGIFNFNDDKMHSVTVKVADVHGNRSELSFRVRSVTAKAADNINRPDTIVKIMPYNKTNRFVAENISVTIPAGALYDTLGFSYKKISALKGMLSDLHCINDKFTPLHKAYSLSVKPSAIPAGKETKIVIIQDADNHRKIAYTGKWTEGYLTADLLSFGKFYVGIDTVPPVISANGSAGGELPPVSKEIKIRITDELSGIKSYEPAIDGNWALFEYDQKNNLLVYRCDEQRITKGTKHSLILKVTDNCENTSIFKGEFTW
jgi:hypothetical protein